jgi:chemotaxis signal transduction protein
MQAEPASSQLDASRGAGPSEVLRILEQRARTLARPLDADEVVETIPLLVVEVGPERYAIPVPSVHEIKPLASVTSLPGMPSFWAGLVNLRGRLVPALDLGMYLALPHSEDGFGDEAKLIFVGADDVEVALIVNRVREIRQTPAEDLRPSVSGGTEGVRIVQNVTKDLVSVLDLGYLLRDQALKVGVDVR